MICNTVTYAGQTLITIYHRGFDRDIGSRKLKNIEKLGRYNLAFNETVVSDNIIDSITGWVWNFEGLLEAKDDKNPYSEAACAYIQEYVYLNKPDIIFDVQNNEYRLKMTTEQLQKLNEFIKKYTGYDIAKNPMSYGNIIIFESNIRSYHAKGEEGLVISDLDANTRVIVRFKDNNRIVSTKIFSATQHTKAIELISDRKWNCHDIEIYKDDKLIYIDKNVSYIRRMHLNMQVSGQSKKIELKKLARDFAVKSDSSEIISVIGDREDELKELYFKSNHLIANRLKQEIDDNRVIFINPGELDKAIKLITEVLRSNYKEIWLFDAYFTDKYKIAYTIDWLRIIANCSTEAKEINIAFFCKSSEKAYGVQEIIQLVKDDSVIRDVLKSKKNLGLRFYQTKAPIHDRFIIPNDGDKFSGIAIGTSFNSLGENHYCIYKLSHASARNIWNDLKLWLENGNIEDLGNI